MKVFEKGIPDNKVVLIFIPILNLLLLAGLISVIALTKTIKFSTDKITVNYILRFKKITFQVSEMIGFNWDTLTGPADYKRIAIWFSGSRKLRFTDFEIGNFYKVETFLIENFQICTVGGKIATEKQINSALELSKEIDLTQIKRIKYILIFLWALIGFIFYQTAIDLLKYSDLRRHVQIMFSISIVGLILSLRKYYNENKRKEKITSSAQHMV
jgi:hypothetical protein